MSKASKIIVLCEDKAHEVFVRRFLKIGWQVPIRNVHVCSYPCGKGSGKNFVDDNISKEVESCRKRQALSILVVVRDADEDSVEDVFRILNGKLKAPRESGEPIVYFIPKWHVETWIAFLDEKNVDEEEKTIYKNEYGKLAVTKNSHQYIDNLSNCCKKKKPLKSPPPSLRVACEEFDRIRDLL